MHCSDLERYLEAVLDGRLGRSRATILRRHITSCGSCRSRVDELRTFEHDLRRRFRAMSKDASLWLVLDPEFVASHGAADTPGPPPQEPPVAPVVIEVPADTLTDGGEATDPAPRQAEEPGLVRRTISLAAVLFVVGLTISLVVGGGELFGLWSQTPAIADTYRAVATNEQRPSLQTADERMLQHWLVAHLGKALPPVPTASGLTLVGGDVQTLKDGKAAMIVYHGGESPILLFVRPDPHHGRAQTSLADEKVDGLNRLSWHEGGYDYLLVSNEPHEKLIRLSR